MGNDGAGGKKGGVWGASKTPLADRDSQARAQTEEEEGRRRIFSQFCPTLNRRLNRRIKKEEQIKNSSHHFR